MWPNPIYGMRLKLEPVITLGKRYNTWTQYPNHEN